MPRRYLPAIVGPPPGLPADVREALAAALDDERALRERAQVQALLRALS